MRLAPVVRFIVVVAPFRFGRGLVDVDFGPDDLSYPTLGPSSVSGLLARFLRGFGMDLEEARLFVLEGVAEEVALRFLLGAGESER